MLEQESNDGAKETKVSLDDPHTPRLRRIYLEARAIRSESARSRFLAEACKDDVSLRGEIEAMLSVDAQHPNLLRDAVDGLKPFAEAIVSQVAEREDVDGRRSVQSREKSFASLVGEILGSYKLLEVIGEGGMGTVYRAQQLGPVRREVAIKVIKAGMDSQQVLKRFRIEQETMARLSHPGITKILDAGTTDNQRPFLVMELVNGVAIDEYCVEQNLSLIERIELFIEICNAIEHANARGIVHRDLKPSNILITEVNGRAAPIIIDFGVAKALFAEDQSATKFTDATQLLGTPMYMSPEQTYGPEGKIDSRTDVYSLGIMLYELVVGVTPFDHCRQRKLSQVDLHQAIRNEQPMRPSARILSERRSFALPSPHRESLTVGIPSERWAGNTSSAQLSPEERSLSESSQHERAKEPKQNNPAPHDIHSWLPRVRSELDWIVLKATQKEPELRYATAGELAADLYSFTAGLPVSARRPSIDYVFGNFIKRHRVAISFITCILLTAGIASLIAMRSYNRADEAETLAKQQAAQVERLQLTEQARARELRNAQIFALDALEFTELQKLGEAFQSNDFASMASHPLPRASDGNFMGEDVTQRNQPTLPDQPSLRRLLTLTANPQPQREFSHSAAVSDIDISPDRRYLASACEDGFAYVWDLESAWDLASDRAPRKYGPIGPLPRVSFSPDGQLLATGDQDSSLTIWDLDSGEKRHTGIPDENGIESLRWSPDGRALAVGYRYGPVRLVDRQAKRLASFGEDLEHKGRNRSLLFSPNGDTLISGLRDRGLNFWEIGKPNRPYRTVGEAVYPRIMIWLDEQGDQFISTTRENLGILTSRVTGEQSLFLLPGDFPIGADYSVRNNSLLLGYDDGTIKLNELRKSPDDGEMQCIAKSSIQAHNADAGGLNRIRFLTETDFFSAGDDGFVKQWSLDQFDAPEEIDLGPMYFAEIDQTGSIISLAPGDQETTAKLLRHRMPYDRTPEVIATVTSYPPSVLWGLGEPVSVPIAPFAISEHSKFVATAHEDAIEIRSLVDGRMLCEIPTEKGARRLALSADGSRLGAVLGEDEYFIWESQNAWSEPKLIQRFQSGGGTFRFEDDGANVTILAQSKAKTVSVATGKTVREWSGRTAQAYCISDSQKSIAIYSPSRLEIFDRESGSTLLSTRVEEKVCQLCFCDQDRLLVALDIKRGITCWHLPTKQSFTLRTPPQNRPGINFSSRLRLHSNGKTQALTVSEAYFSSQTLRIDTYSILANSCLPRATYKPLIE